MSQIVTSQLSITFLILEGVSFNVNQAGETSLGTGDNMPRTGSLKEFSKLVEPQAITFRVGKYIENGMVANGISELRITRRDAYTNQKFSYFPFFV